MATTEYAPHLTTAAEPTPMPCSECASPGMPYMIDPVPNSNRILVSVRCISCRHEWALRLTVEAI
jgi:hypothetical protein